MNLKDVSIGFTHALNKGIPEIDERAIRNEELGMRKDEHALKLRKAQREEELLATIKGHVDEYRNAVANLPPGPAIGGGVPQQQSPTSVQQSPAQMPTSAIDTGLPQQQSSTKSPTNIQQSPTPAPVDDVWGDAGVTVRQAPAVTTSGQPNVDSGFATAIAQPTPQAPPQAPGQQPVPGPVELKSKDPVVNPPQNVPALQMRGEMMMKIHDTLLANGQFDAANKIQKAEFNNILAIAKISPQGAMKAWNSNKWITQKYGPVKPGDVTQKGEWSFMKYGGDGLVRWNKNGQFEMVQKPTAAGGKTPTPQMYVEKAIGPNQKQKFQWNPQTNQNDIPFGEPYRIHKPDGGGSGGDGKGSPAETREFRMHLGQLNGLYKSMAGIQKGVDPITQQVIPQDQIEAAKATIQGQINSLESLMQEDFPDHWARYRKQPKAGAAIGGNGPQDYKANKTGNISKAADFFRDNTGSMGQKAMYDKLIKAGYSEDSIKQGWRQFKGIK